MLLDAYGATVNYLNSDGEYDEDVNIVSVMLAFPYEKQQNIFYF